MEIRNKSILLPILALGVGIVIYLAMKDRPSPVVAGGNSGKPTQSESVIAPDDKVHPTYAGSASCKECHEKAYAGWEKSNHGLAERNVRMDMDEKAFSPKQTLVHGKDTSETFVDAAGLVKVLTRGLDHQRHEYPIARIIGNNPLRQFLVPAPGNRLQTCDVSYDPKKNELFDVYGDEERNPGDWGAWTGQGMNWNAMCAACHNTRLRKNYDPQTDTYHTAMAEMTVGCEACHGPMKDHVDWQKKKPLVDPPKDPTIRKFSKDQMLDTCGACHARRGELTGDLIPGELFSDHFSLTVTNETDTYHPDGQVRDENYEYTSFLSSRMHHVGIRCVDCHDPHTGKRLLDGNALCMKCHGGGTQPPAPFIIPTQHGHHKQDSKGNDCTGCHMPITTYMQRHPRHDHGFTIPNPQLTIDFGIPNACNRCHNDKDADWALKSSKEWYGDRLLRPSHTRAILIAQARRGDDSAHAGLIEMLKTEQIPAWKATACHLLARWVMDPEVTRILLDQFYQSSPLVREAAVRTLVYQTRQENTTVINAIKPLLDDPSRSVRIAAAWALVPTLDLNSRAGKELVHMLDLNSDQPTGRMQLSQFAFLRGDAASAIKQIRKAILWDPNSPPFHHDLAIMLSTTGDTPGAIKALQDAIRLDPREAEYHYKLALALNETGDIAKSAAALEKTVELDPSRARAWYNLGLARSGMNQPNEAIAALVKAESADPTDAGIPYARATVLARIGRRDEAISAANRALQL
ncbi:MAG: tetratricopeptide repeat protein, partial [Verrucomicrobiota bacterium]